MADPQSPPLELWQAGEEIDHNKANQVVQALQNITRGSAPPQQVNPDPIIATLKQFKIISISGDYLTCAAYDGNIGLEVNYKIAKPYLLRRSLTSRNSIAYSYSSDQTRTATGSAGTENQIVTPAYVAGDIITAGRNPEGGTCVLDGNSLPITWVDMNNDARQWAKVAT